MQCAAVGVVRRGWGPAPRSRRRAGGRTQVHRSVGLRDRRLWALRLSYRLSSRRCWKLCQRVLAGVSTQVCVLHFELVDPLHQFSDALFQHFHFFAHREHQVALNQILKQRKLNVRYKKQIRNRCLKY